MEQWKCSVEDMGVKKRFLENMKALALIPYFDRVAIHFARYAKVFGYHRKAKNGRFLVFRPSLGFGSGDGLSLLAIALFLRKYLDYEPVFVFDDTSEKVMWLEDWSVDVVGNLPLIDVSYKKLAYKRLLRELNIEYYTFSSIKSKCDFQFYEVEKWEDYWAKVSVYRRYKLPLLGKIYSELRERYLIRLSQFIYLRKKLCFILRKVNPDFALLWHGDLPISGDALVATYLNMLGVPFLFIKRGVYDGTIQLRWDSTFSSPYDKFFYMWQPDSETLDRFSSYWNERVHHKVHSTAYGVNQERTKELISSIRSRAAGRKIVLVFPNIMWDGSVYTGYRFAYPLEWLSGIIRIARKHEKDIFVVIRMHPHESVYYKKPRTYQVVLKLLGDLPSNVWLLPPDIGISTYELLLRLNEALITVYNGTIGLELPILTGRIALLGGMAHYSKKGFTEESSNWEDYEKKLIEFDGDGSEKVRKEAIFYASYHFVFSQLYFPIVKNVDIEDEWYVMFPGVLKDIEIYDRWSWYLGKIPELTGIKIKKELPIY